MPIEIKELTIKMQVKDPHQKLENRTKVDERMEERVVEKSVQRVLKLIERKAER